MLHFETTAHVGPDGTLIVRAPDLANRDVRVQLDAAPTTNGHTAKAALINLPPRPSAEERRRILNATIGTINDPTFERPPQGQSEDVEPLD